jgi:hypothetical protein
VLRRLLIAGDPASGTSLEGMAALFGLHPRTLNRRPITILFSDRPERLAGHMTNENFVLFWGEGADSFKSDPPNGTLSVLEGGAMDNVVMTLRNPQLAGRDLSYEVVVLEGKPPASGGAASLFIDIIGMPLTPVSFAGARRRMWRR